MGIAKSNRRNMFKLNQKAVVNKEVDFLAGCEVVMKKFHASHDTLVGVITKSTDKSEFYGFNVGDPI